MPRTATFFIDAQNFYRSAREAFLDDSDPSRFGNFHPRALAELIARRDPDRIVGEVRLYTGRPDRYLQRRAHAASVRQSNAWAREGCRVFPRILRYPPDWPNNSPPEKPREKGVDVELAVTLVSMALRGELDVAVILSADTDLRPALEEMRLRCPHVTVEVASWRTPTHRRRLSNPGQSLWCHWLEVGDFELVRDDTDYNISTRSN